MIEIYIRAKRPFYLGGKVITAGETVGATSLDAVSAVGSGRAEYVTEQDRETAVSGARKAEADACQTRTTGKSFWNRSNNF